MKENRARFTNSRLRAAIAMAMCVAVLLALPSIAHAETWASQYPFGVVRVQPKTVTVDVFGTGTLNAKTAVISIDGVAQRTFLKQGAATGHWSAVETQVDGVWTIQWVWVADTGGTTKANLYCYSTALSDGAHSVAATVKDNAGKAFTATPWIFNLSIPPTISSVTPAAGTTVSTSTPTVSAKITDNGLVGAVSATINGVAATVGTPVGGVYPITGFTLTSDRPVTVVVIASDTAGNSSTKTWSFNVSITRNLICATCHGTQGYATDNAMGPDCVACHGDVIAVHGAVHNANPDYSAYVAGDVSYNAPAQGQKHGSGMVLKCTNCHASSNLLTVHLGANSCPICHGTGGPRASFTTWDKGCQQGGCHTPTQHLTGGEAGIPYIQHNDDAAYTAHNAVTVLGRDAGYKGGCIAVCHERGCLSSCHTVKDGSSDISAPLTRVSQISTDPVTWKLYPVDSQSGVAKTYYSFDGAPFALYGAAEAANGISGAFDAARIGQHALRVFSVDVAGNTEATRTTNYVTTGIDTTRPVITTNGIRTGSSVVATSFAISVKDPMSPAPCTGAASLHIEYKSYVRQWEYYAIPTPIWYPVNYAIPTSSWDTTTTFSGLENQAWDGFGGGTVSNKGHYMFVVRYTSTDYAGNTSAIAEDTVYIDNEAPVSNVATYGAGVYRWKINAYDTAAGIASTYYSFDGGPFVAYSAADAANGFMNTQPGGTDAGFHTISYYSVDVLGHVEATKTHTYKVIEMTTPLASLSATITPTSIFINMWDPEGPLPRSGIKSIVGFVRQGGYTRSINATFPAGDPAAVRSVEVTVPSDGYWELQYYVYDWEGNQQWYYQGFKRDTAPPSTNLGGAWNTAWQLAGSDGQGVGLAASYISWDGGPYTEAVYQTWAAAFTTPAPQMTSGTHTLSYYSVDKFGFAETPKSTSWLVP